MKKFRGEILVYVTYSFEVEANTEEEVLTLHDNDELVSEENISDSQQVKFTIGEVKEKNDD